LQSRYFAVSRNQNLEKYIVVMYHRTFETVILKVSKGLRLAMNQYLSVNEVNALIRKCWKLVTVFKQSSLKTTWLYVAEENLDLKQLHTSGRCDGMEFSSFNGQTLLKILPGLCYTNIRNMHIDMYAHNINNFQFPLKINITFIL
jgi:hypothetical protein